MAFSKCPHCNGGSFKLVTQEPSGSRYKINFLQCSTCNAPVGTMDFFNTGAQLEEQKQELNQLKSEVRQVHDLLRRVAQHLNNSR